MTYWKNVFFKGLLYVFAAFGLVQVIGLLVQKTGPYIPRTPTGQPTGWSILFTPLQFFAFLLVVFGFVAIWEYFRLRGKNRGAR